MKVLQLVTQPQRRGAEIFAVDLCRELERLGHETSITYLYGEPAGDVCIRAQDCLMHGAASHAAERVLGFHPGLLMRLVAHVEACGPDVVQVNGSRSVKYGSLVRRMLPRAAWALVYRSIGDPERWIGGGVRRWLYAKLVISMMDAVVGVSGRSLEGVRRLYGFCGPAIKIPGGVDPTTLVPRRSRDELRQELGTPPDQLVVLFVGRLSREKAPERFLRVLAPIAARVRGLEAWILGDGPLRGRLEELAVSLTTPVRFFGERSDVACFMNAADLLLLTSDTEGIPGVLLEAGCIGLAAVARRVGGVEECLLGGRTGILVEPDDEEGLATEASLLLLDNERRQRMGGEARQWISSAFALKSVAGRYLELYAAAIEQRRANPHRQAKEPATDNY